MTWPRWCAAVTVPLLALGAALGLVGAVEAGDWPAAGHFATLAAVGLPGVILGNVVAWHRRGNLVGPLLAWTGLIVATMDTGTFVLAGPAASLPVSDELVALSQGAWMWLFVPLAELMLIFPTGLTTSPRWRAVAVALPVIAVVFCVLAAVVPGPFVPPFQDRPHVFGTLPAAFGVLMVALLPVFAGLLIGSALSLVVRYRQAGPSTRAQIKWLALAGLSVPLTLFTGWVGYLLGHPEVVVGGLVVMNVAVPAAVTVAIVKHDLFDIDQLLSDGVRLTAVAGAVLGAYAVVSGVLGLLLGGQSPLGVAVATAAAALVLVPARRYISSHVERRLYPSRWRAQQAIQLLTMQTHAGTSDPEELESRLRVALHDPGLRVGYLVPGSLDVYDQKGRPLLVHETATHIERGGHRIGVLQPALPIRPKLARDLASSCALLVELVRLRLERAAALEDATLSRTRLLHAAYQERRRVVNDLHDGSQRRLVSLGVSLRLAQRHLDDGTVNVDDLIETSVAELGAVVAELRQLANGIRPSCLDDGLDAALSQLASRLPLAVDLDLQAGDLPDEVSTTAYFVASEALTNAVKHSHANRVGLAVVQDQGTLRLVVSDDGAGGARIRAGHGLPGLQDRVAAHGGSLIISSPEGLGTRVEVLLPCAS